MPLVNRLCAQPCGLPMPRLPRVRKTVTSGTASTRLSAKLRISIMLSPVPGIGGPTRFLQVMVCPELKWLKSGGMLCSVCFCEAALCMGVCWYCCFLCSATLHRLYGANHREGARV